MIRTSHFFRILFLLITLGIIGGGIGYWYYHLMIIRHEELSSKAKTVYTTTFTYKGKRGKIFDAYGNLLVGSRYTVDVLAEPRKIPPWKKEEVVHLLAKEFDVDPQVLSERFASKRVEVVVKKRVPYYSPQKTLSWFEQQKIPGLRYVDSEERYYPKGHLAIQVLGLCSEEGKGIGGIEFYADKWLTPKEGSMTYERDRYGRLRLDNQEEKNKNLNGYDVWLTIVEPIQEIVERHLDDLVEKWRPIRAYAIMANPKNGAILAFAQRPTLNPENRTNLDPEQWQALAVECVYHPGSTMKPMVVVGALDYGVIRIHDRINCEKGLWFYGGFPLRDSGHSYEYLTVTDIIAKSSNIGTAKIALQLGAKRLYQTLRRFGFGQKTGIELPHESSGLLPPVSQWDVLSITRFPIGQGLAVTPLQMLQAFCALANQGKMPQLHLIHKVVDPVDGKVIHETIPRIRLTVARPEPVAWVVEAMVKVVSSEGTAAKAAIPGYTVAGKTGTAQKWDPVTKSYDGRKYISSFIGFVPAYNPAFVLLIVADEPQDKYYGGTVCAPVFRAIGEEVLRYLNVPQETISQNKGNVP